MPKKSESVTIEITFRRDASGRIVIGYRGEDDRTPEIGEFVLDAIVAAIDAA